MHYLIKKIVPSTSLLNDFRYWLCIILLNLLPTTALATSDAGEIARLIGFMGNNQTYALIAIESIQGEGQINQFITINMSETDNNWLDEFTFTSESDEKKIGSIWDEENTITAKQETAYYQFYLSSIESPRKSIYQQKFTPAAESKHYSAKPLNENYTQDDADKAEFCLDEKNQATLSLVTLKQFDSSLYWDSTHQSACFDNGQPLCDNCTQKIMDVNGEEQAYIACPPGLGKPVANQHSEHPQNSDCDCHNTGHIMTAKLSISGKSVMGPEFMVTGEAHQQGAEDEPPNFFYYNNELYGITLYQNNRNDVIVVGSIANMPMLNGTFYPLVVAYPNNLMDDEK